MELLSDITEKQARAEGFLGRDEFIKAFLTMRPYCIIKSWVWAIEFERITAILEPVWASQQRNDVIQ